MPRQVKSVLPTTTPAAPRWAGSAVSSPPDLPGAAPGKSGGATVDAEGYLWSARREAGQVLRFAPDGSIERGIALDAPQPACPAFGGPGLSTLYVSTGRQGMGPDARVAAPLSGAMFRQVVDVRGLPEPRFLHA